MVFTDNILLEIIGMSLVLLTVIITIYFKRSFSYWKKKGLEGPEPSIPFGNTKDLFLGRKGFSEIWKDVYLDLKYKGLKHGGGYFFSRPIYIPVDLQLIKNITQNDFVNFSSHGLYGNDDNDPLTLNIFRLDGPRWKHIRTKMTPTFTSSKMKMMFETLVECSKGLKDVLQEFSETNTPVGIKDVMARFTTDVIGSCAFGIDCDCLKNPDSEFLRYGIKALNGDAQGTIRTFSQILIPHPVLRFLKFRAYPSDASNFFQNMVKQTIGYREKNKVTRKDFMHLLIGLKNDETVNNETTTADDTEGKLTLEEIIGQAFIFFAAGSDTSSTTMTFIIYELAVNPDIQDKLREEINDVLEKYENNISYDAIMDMPYLEQVVCEGLRKYPPGGTMTRKCTEDYRVPDTNIVIREGTIVLISILGIHHDPENYPDPEKFDPKRFDGKNKFERHQFAWIPFGEGPRICIGFRFALMQIKLAVVTLVKEFKISLNEKTETPIILYRKGHLLSTDTNIWINVDKI